MPSANDLHGQFQLACQYFHSRVGLPLEQETVEFLKRGVPRALPNYQPIPIHIGPSAPIRVAWLRLSELWINPEWGERVLLETSESLHTAHPQPDGQLLSGATFRAAWIGGGPVSLPLEGWRELAIRDYVPCGFDWWTALLLEFDRGFLEIAKGIGTNRYAVHAARPAGEWVRCA